MSAHDDFPLASATAALLVSPGTIGSTNDHLAGLLRGDPGLIDGASVISSDQTAGRGRLGRVWSAPPGAMVAISTLIRLGEVPSAKLGWLPLIAGVAVRDALEEVCPGIGAKVKWPNDVLVGSDKISGILCELQPGGGNLVIVGTGINTHLDDADRPTDTATSLAREGFPGISNDSVANAYLARLAALVADWRDAGGDELVSGIADRVRSFCVTLGERVRVTLGEDSLLGTASGIDASARLLVTDDSGVSHVVTAGDVTHVRSV